MNKMFTVPEHSAPSPFPTTAPALRSGLLSGRTSHWERMRDVIDQILRYLTPSEQAVYLRLWRLTHAEDKTRCAIRYEDLARLAHVSVSTLKRVLKKLAHRGLVHVEWQAKHASLFTVQVRPLAPSPAIDLGLSPKLYDFFSDEDRSLFLSCKRTLSPHEQKALDQEAGGHPLLADLLLFQRTFGPDRQRKYEPLIGHLIQNPRPF
jgi:AraC-like DNA-binding protein